jgi:hypothetical protein
MRGRVKKVGLKNLHTSHPALSVDEYEESSTSDEEDGKTLSERKAARRLQRSFRMKMFVKSIEKAMMLSKKRKVELLFSLF